MSKVKSNYEIISDKAQNPVVSSEYVKHGTGWLDSVINQSVNTLNNKADRSYVDTELAKKASITQLGNKADSSTVSQLQSDVNSKADQSSVSLLDSRVSDVEAEQDTLSARMDTFTTLTEGSTTGDAELADAHVGADGKTYTNVGDAIRDQISDVNKEVNAVKNVFDISNLLTFTGFVSGYLSSDGSSISATSEYKTSDFVEIPSSSKITFTKCNRYAVYNSSKIKLSVGNPGGTGTEPVTFTTQETAKYIRLTYPVNATGLCLSVGESLDNSMSINNLSTDDKLSKLEDNVNSMIDYDNMLHGVEYSLGYLKSEGTGTNYTADYVTCDYVEIPAGTEKITMSACSRYCIYDATYNRIQISSLNSKATVNLLSGAKYLRITYPVSSNISERIATVGTILSDRASINGLFSEVSVYVGNNAWCDFSDIQSAIDSITDDSNTKHYVVYVDSGTYSKFNMISNPERARYISIIGISGNNYDTVVFDDKGNYNNSPATVHTNGSIKNISFVNRTDSDKKEIGTQTYAFAVHDGAYTDGVGSTNTIYENCYFYSNAGGAYGCGLKQNDVRKFVNCKFETDNNANVNTGLWQGAFYVHTNGTSETTGQKLIVENCVVKCASNQYACSIQERTDYSSPLHFESRNTLYVGNAGANAYLSETINPTLSFGNVPVKLNNY